MMHTKNIELPKIKNNDLVLISTREYNSLFYSNGRYAQTDLVITNLEAELAKIEVPEKIIEDARKSAFDYYSGVFSDEEEAKLCTDLINQRVIGTSTWYKKSTLIDRAVSAG